MHDPTLPVDASAVTDSLPDAHPEDIAQRDTVPVEEAPAPPFSPEFDVLAEQLDRLADHVETTTASLQRAIDEKAGMIEFRDRQLDLLHRELQDYKSDLLTRVLTPVFNALIRLHGGLDRALDALAADTDPSAPLRVLGDFRDDLELLLQDQGVTTFEDYAEGDAFNPKRQQASGFTTTADASAHGQVAARLRPGFEYGGRLLVKEKVNVFRHVPAEPDAAPSNPSQPLETQP